MKKLLLIIITISLCINGNLCYANNSILAEDITVIFPENTALTDAQKEQFISIITTNHPNPSAYSILCIFGHDEITQYAEVIKHKVFSVEPRCADQFYRIITCSRCDYMDTTLVSQAFFNCCPED